VSTTLLIATILTFGPLAWLAGWQRATRAAHRSNLILHSRPGYSGSYAMLWTVLPALGLAIVWASAERMAIGQAVLTKLPAEVRAMPESARSLVVGTVGAVATGIRRLTPAELDAVRSNSVDVKDLLGSKGIPLASTPPHYVVDAALTTVGLTTASRLAATAVCLTVALGGLAFALMRIGPALRARNIVERMMRLGLIAASTVAVVTTIGIIFSMLFETLHFFNLVPASDFFFGLVWDPRFSAPGRTGSGGQFGIVPLLWGTLYISFVALLVAVPVGLFAAIYMAEYAGQRVRAASKPLLELLSGIPTIVYGFFALISFGPLLRDVGAKLGLSISASSVLTAGVIMGVMLIPFISSLSDDIINAVPQSLRDGSYALGATRSETIKRVILPAALPGIVGATLLAASRAIGETMIVVLAAGIAANLTLNPFEAVTTITVKIVSQLTGDLQFNSPQTLVAFALGLTLFAFTLVLNIYALYMVRKYHEQYE
jgi:phosphate transport system permease protein